MSTETGATKRRLSRRTSSKSEEGAIDTATNKSSEDSHTTTKKPIDEQQLQHGGSDEDETKNVTKLSGIRQEGKTDAVTATSATTSRPTTSTSNTIENLVPGDGSRQIIAVSANKNPTAFFQLARKFLMTNEMCDLSALEGAIVSAVDAAHLLERSKLATIVRINTSYVNVEPKRRRQQKGEMPTSETTTREVAPSRSVTDHIIDTMDSGGGMQQQQQQGKQSLSTTKTTAATTRLSASSGGGSRELRRARILVTVKRTESYKRWLEENPIQRQAIIAGTATVTAEEIVGKDPSLPSSK
uniref:DNA/RNA-binding protein Alba-like domain-containing protein n=2 Tax=Pseudo-nitzschia australis TaxID=44445 RepID=A0A7S4EHE7_9STRA|mmetsp:Transcript_27796/g.61235  ORF Transcript_27796/g.61235 Transcript_27796/m.61235 type:complete len:299 (+) Transcript_27796:608-1504(+)|eukprot:CAMPEP_0168175026 /NCGR_PEP_ID=MMETSP0139_2-20121125/6868_1 /TAXON_ID=44445 /ORGANISM="Pseudo-nitzschia australis, Strain 10249 10 AB" /LENGTH=298 /DNA_ID=CAMNT_0008093317 /DNA_START=663 /DNA_END=1559 /DNA_ORIENTATION=+